MSDHEPAIILEWRVKQIVEHLLGRLHLRGLSFLDSTDLEQALHAVIVVLKVLSLIVPYGLVEGPYEVVKLLPNVISQRLLPLLLILLAFDDAHTLLLDFSQFLIKL